MSEKFNPTHKARVILRMVVQLALFYAALYFGLVKGVEGAANVVQFYVWFIFIISLGMLSEDFVQALRKRNDPRLPGWLSLAHNLCTITTLVWYGWAWTASAATVSAILLLRRRQPAAGGTNDPGAG